MKRLWNTIYSYLKGNTREQIKREAARRGMWKIEEITRIYYCVKNLRDRNRRQISIRIEFCHLDRQPQVGDILFLPEGIINNPDCRPFGYYGPFTFSTIIGKACARPPHSILERPDEFLILRYAKGGEMVLFERWYG